MWLSFQWSVSVGATKFGPARRYRTDSKRPDCSFVPESAMENWLSPPHYLTSPTFIFAE
jgi:hypothetical protein